jgi:DNA invertase Pin-like site-specific DNA recombinase
LQSWTGFPISGLTKRKVDFVACDMPSANAFMINVYAAVAQEERRMISERTRAGLAAAKRRGVKLGGRNAQSDKTAAEASERAEQLRPVMAELAALSANQAAAELNRRKIATASGGQWFATQVIRLRQRLAP